MRIVCAASNCKYSSKSEDSSNVIFINFPNDDTAKTWAEYCGRSDLTTKSNAELHSNHYICSHHIEDRHYVSKTAPIVIEEGTVPTLFGNDSSIGSDNSINTFDKSQHLQEVGDSMPLIYYNENVEMDNVSIRLDNLCRICGESTLNGTDIFATKGIELRLKERINLHMPISIDIDDCLPQKMCSDCCNKLEIAHSLVVSCLKTDIRLKRFLNIEKESGYENKYSALVDECSLEIDQEMCIDDNMHADSFIINKLINPDSETSLRGLENEEIRSNNCQTIAKSVMPLRTTIQTCSDVNVRSDMIVTEEILKVLQDKIQNENSSFLCLQCQTFCKTWEIFENHKIFCTKERNVSKHINISRITENEKCENEPNRKVENSQICNEEFDGKQIIEKATCESVHCSICNRTFKSQQDYDNHKCLHRNFTETSKWCGHCKKIYHNKKDLLIHIMESHEGRLLLKCSTCDKTYEKWSSLDIHEATHKMDKPYLCDLCGKRFKHSNNLRGHKRIHLDESIKKRHVCDICSNAFRSR